MEPNDLERTIGTGLRLTRAVIGLGVSLAMVPVRLVLRAVSPPPEEQRWEPISEPPPAPVPAADAGTSPAEAAAPPPEPPAPMPVPPEPPAPMPVPPETVDLTSADAARIREAEREAQTTPDSPGPEIHVEEPWEGYDQMTVTEVRRRLRGVNPTVTAMVRLYEETHRNRKGVIDATSPS
ncbi:hypothetical protein [Capillimicrobium parvum]|uniref:Uncharacterized protein n=1 Tax=Capillimicrobium parvum TaxID=2884022 RepID=A0A9E7BZZ1_9ACTN|nr:hypothetical protein [Capillimicrobium parvum]UGS35084.1 hypothetical protein DSM104329_01468 [Capillimicrobium parvum]